MRHLLLVALVGCGSTSRPAPSNTAAPTPVATTAPAPDPDAPPREEPKDLPCEPRMETWADGLHDRYLFHDDATGLSGYKNKAGAIVIPAQYREAYPFGPGGIAAVNQPGPGFGFIDPHGTLIARAHAMDNGPDYFQDKLARIIGPGGKVGYIDSAGTIVIAPRFDEAMPFCNGKAAVKLAGQDLTIDKTGSPAAP